MRKLLLIGVLIATPSLSYSGLSTGTVLLIDTLEQKNSGTFPIVNAPDVAVSTDNFSGNLGTGDMDLQMALETIDGLSVGGGSGVSVYPATATASFPLGLSASTMTITDIHASGDVIVDGVIGSTTGAFAYGASTVTYDAPPIDTVDRIPILNNGAVSWDAAVTDGARLASTQTFTGANVFGSSVSLTGLPGAGVLYADGTGLVSTTTASGGSGDIEGVNVTAPVTGGGASGTVTIGLQQISLSTGVTGSLADGSLSANVPLLNATQTFSGANTFSGAVSMSSATTMTASTMTYTDVHVVVVGTLTVNGVDVSGGGGGSGDVEEITVTAPITGGGTSGTVNIGIQQISLSTGVTGTLADGSLSSNVPLLNATQTFTGGNTFGGALTISSGTSIAVSTLTLTDVDFILTGTMTVNGVEITGTGGGGSGDITAVVAGYGLTGGATSGSATLNLDPDTTSYIQAGETLQSGATFYVSSATVDGYFYVNSVPSSSFGNERTRLSFDLNNNEFLNLHRLTFERLEDANPSELQIINTGSDGLNKVAWGVGNTSAGTALYIRQYINSASVYQNWMMSGPGGGEGSTIINSTGTNNINLSSYEAALTVAGWDGLGSSTKILDVQSDDGDTDDTGATSLFSINHDTATFTVPLYLQDGSVITSTSGFGGGNQSKSFTITAVTSDGDFGAIWKAPAAITITRVNVVQVGATNVVGQLQECNSDGASCAAVDSSDITATSGNAADDGSLSNASIDANDWIGWSTTSVSGTNTRLSVTFDYTVN